MKEVQHIVNVSSGKDSGACAAGISLKWGERAALANLVAQVDAEDDE